MAFRCTINIILVTYLLPTYLHTTVFCSKSFLADETGDVAENNVTAVGCI